MPVTIKFDPTANSLQAQVIPNASANNDGVMSKEQSAKLGGLVQTEVSAGAGLVAVPDPIVGSGAISMPNVGPGAGLIGGTGDMIQRITLDAQGRVTAAAAVTAPSISAGVGLVAAPDPIVGVGSISMPNVGPGAGTIGGAGEAVTSITLDAQGRVVAATALDTPLHLVGAVGEPAFQAGNANFGPPYNTVAFYKNPFGQVFLRGAVAPSGNTAIFTLPVGFRPGATSVFPMISVAAGVYTIGSLFVLATGDVLINTGGVGQAAIWLDGMSFRAV